MTITLELSEIQVTYLYNLLQCDIFDLPMPDNVMESISSDEYDSLEVKLSEAYTNIHGK